MKPKLCLILAAALLVALPPGLLWAQDISPAADPALTPDQARPEGFVMIDGRVHLVRRGVATPLQEDMFLRVTPTGVIGFDDVPRIINNNSMLRLDGSIVAAPPNAVLPPPALVEATELPDPRLAPRSVMYGTNVTGLMPNQGAVQPKSRFVSAKKSTSAKSSGKSTAKSGTAKSGSAKSKVTVKSVAKAPPKKSVQKAAPPAPVAFPAFNDATLELPDLDLGSVGPAVPVIDATSTMLYMTNTPGQALTPEDASIGASLGTQTTGAEARLGPQASAPEAPDAEDPKETKEQ